MKCAVVPERKIYCITYEPFSWQGMQFGQERRKAIIDHVLQMRGLLVNRKYCLLTDQDPDLKHMLKRGLLVRARANHCHKQNRRTYLVLK